MTGLNPRKTYWHLQELRRKPDEYDIGTSRLLHDDGRVFETDVPVLPWYEEHARASFLYREQLDKFEDPRRTTYRSYTELQAAKEQFVDGLFNAIDATDSDRGLPADWLAELDQILPVLRFPVHGLQMVSAYVSHLAPSGRVVAAGAFQCGNELRRVQCLARRMFQLSQRRPDFGSQARAHWQDAPVWQPLRKLIEQLLVTYDWSEALIALQVVVKPMFDYVFMRALAQRAERASDPLFGQLLLSLDSDCEWQREVTTALFTMLTTTRPELRPRIAELREKWAPRTREALHVLLPLVAHDATRVDACVAELDAFCAAYWSGMGCGRESASGGGDVRAGA